MPIIAESSIRDRRNWIDEIQRLSGDFGADTTRLSSMLTEDVLCKGTDCLRDHLRLCGAIPEKYRHDSSEEKLYSKYTDHLLSIAFGSMGVRSLVLSERADAADVECWVDDYEFVADAKAFRLSRTAKNQKDFKVQAMHSWKRHRQHAMVVCPLYQLPARSSQIYYQAINSEVCVFSFSHLSLLISFAEATSKEHAKALLRQLFAVTSTLQPSKDANSYWAALNRKMLDAHLLVADLWRIEKAAAAESLIDAKEEGLLYIGLERSRIMRMGHDEALRELIKLQNLEARARVINAVRDNGLMGIV